jgi:hypothetical protein
MEKEALSFEMATAEMEKWLDSKRVSEKRRKDLEKPIEHLISMLQSGNLSIDGESGQLTYKLLWPIEGLTEITFKHRLTVMELQNRTKNLKGDDSDGRIRATIAALTGQSVGILGKLDTDDNRTAEAVAVFFL